MKTFTCALMMYSMSLHNKLWNNCESETFTEMHEFSGKLQQHKYEVKENRRHVLQVFEI